MALKDTLKNVVAKFKKQTEPKPETMRHMEEAARRAKEAAKAAKE